MMGPRLYRGRSVRRGLGGVVCMYNNIRKYHSTFSSITYLKT